MQRNIRSLPRDILIGGMLQTSFLRTLDGRCVLQLQISLLGSQLSSDTMMRYLGSGEKKPLKNKASKK